MNENTDANAREVKEENVSKREKLLAAGWKENPIGIYGHPDHGWNMMLGMAWSVHLASQTKGVGFDSPEWRRKLDLLERAGWTHQNFKTWRHPRLDGEFTMEQAFGVVPSGENVAGAREVAALPHTGDEEPIPRHFHDAWDIHHSWQMAKMHAAGQKISDRLLHAALSPEQKAHLATEHLRHRGPGFGPDDTAKNFEIGPLELGASSAGKSAMMAQLRIVELAKQEGCTVAELLARKGIFLDEFTAGLLGLPAAGREEKEEYLRKTGWKQLQENTWTHRSRDFNETFEDALKLTSEWRQKLKGTDQVALELSAAASGAVKGFDDAGVVDPPAPDDSHDIMEQAELSETHLQQGIAMSSDGPRYLLWQYFADEHDLSLLESELDDILHEVEKYQLRRMGFEKDAVLPGYIHHNPDARVWATYFHNTLKRMARSKVLEHQKEPLRIIDTNVDQEAGMMALDTDWMHGWFANAMMAMHDSLAPRFKETIDPDSPEAKELVRGLPKDLHTAIGEAFGAGTMCWDPRPEGVFDSEKAEKYMNEASVWLAKYLKSRHVKGYLEGIRDYEEKSKPNRYAELTEIADLREQLHQQKERVFILCAACVTLGVILLGAILTIAAMAFQR